MSHKTYIEMKYKCMHKTFIQSLTTSLTSHNPHLSPGIQVGKYGHCHHPSFRRRLPAMRLQIEVPHWVLR